MKTSFYRQMLVLFRDKKRQWDPIEFLRISKPLALLVYFYNNNFELDDTIQILERIDNFNKNDASKPIIALIFIFANQAYHSREKYGLLKSLHLLRYFPKNLQYQKVWDKTQANYTKEKVLFTLNELEEALRPNELFQIHGFRDIPTDRFNYIAKKQSKLQWFDSNLFYFYNSWHMSKIDCLLKDLDECNPGFPLSLYKTYLLAMIFINRNKLEVMDIIETLIHKKKIGNNKVSQTLLFYSFFLGSDSSGIFMLLKNRDT